SGAPDRLRNRSASDSAVHSSRQEDSGMKPVVGSFTEPQVDRRKVLVGLLFCSAAGLAAWRRPTRHLDYLGRDKLEDIIPLTIGPWKFIAASGLVVPPNDQLSR